MRPPAIVVERLLIRLLSDEESLRYLAMEGIEVEILPTEAMREVVTWALNYRLDGGRAPTTYVITERFGNDMFTDREIDLDEEPPKETIEWILTTLNAVFVERESRRIARQMGAAVKAAADEDVVDVLAEQAAELAAVVQAVTPRRTRVDMRTGMADVLASYDRTVARGGQPEGLLFGLPPVDNHICGIQPSEMGMLIAPTKTGKSFALDFAAYNEWARRQPTVLFTMENSIEMTQQRIACMALHISLERLMRGTLEEAELKLLREWVNDELPKSDTPLHILHPNPSLRTPQALVQQAQALGATNLIVDQLTFMHAVEGRRHESEPQEVARIVHDFKALIGTGRHIMSLLMANQVTRKGTERASSTGFLGLGDSANSSEADRTPDFIFGLYASEQNRRYGRMELQMLGARRVPLKNFVCSWHLDVGRIAVISESVPA